MPDNGGVEPWFTITNNDLRMTNGTLNIGWMSLNPVNVLSGQTVLMIHARLVNDAMPPAIRFTLNENPLSELADAEGNVIDGAKLAIADAGMRKSSEQAMFNTYPNPATDRVTVEYLMSEHGDLTLDVINLQGIKVRTFQQPNLREGMFKTTLNTRDLPAGMYTIRLNANGVILTRKVVITR
jgi:hypothetical protein